MSDYARYPAPLIPLVREWDREWGIRTPAIDKLEQLVAAQGYASTVPLIAMTRDIHQLIQRWFRDKVEQDRYLPGDTGEGKYPGLA